MSKNRFLANCKLCGQLKLLVKSHIIARSFFLHSKGCSKHWSEARQHDSKDVQIWQNGVWDDTIVCSTCEERMCEWDSYGFQILGGPPGGDSFPKSESDIEAFVLKNVDYTKLKLFALSILWRASVSSQPFFARINLGPHEPIIGKMLLQGTPGPFNDYAVFISRLVDQKFPRIIFPPCHQRTQEGINFTLLFLPSIKIMVQVDRRPIPKQLQPAVFKSQRENLLLPMKWLRHEWTALLSAARIFKSRTPGQMS